MQTTQCVLETAVDMFFLCKDTATTEIYTLSLHDALPSCRGSCGLRVRRSRSRCRGQPVAPLLPGIQPQVRPRHRAPLGAGRVDRKSTRLNSSHANISYAVFCLKKKTHNRAIDKTHFALPD